MTPRVRVSVSQSSRLRHSLSSSSCLCVSVEQTVTLSLLEFVSLCLSRADWDTLSPRVFYLKDDSSFGWLLEFSTLRATCSCLCLSVSQSARHRSPRVFIFRVSLAKDHNTNRACLPFFLEKRDTGHKNWVELEGWLHRVAARLIENWLSSWHSGSCLQ